MGKTISDFFKNRLIKGDTVVWMIYFFLCMISLVEVYSASSRLTFDGSNHWVPMIDHAKNLFLGFIAILIVHRIPCKYFMVFSVVLLPIAIGMLLYTAVFGGDSTINGTHRWISLGFCTVQPSEFAKWVLIMFTAMILAKTQGEKDVTVNGKTRKIVGAIKGQKRNFAFTVIGSVTGVICLLIFADNVSTAVMLFSVIVAMMFIGHVPNDLMLKGLGGVVVFGLFLTLLSFLIPSDTLKDIWGLKRIGTVRHRIERMMTSNKEEADNKKNVDSKTATLDRLNGKESQSMYANIAIASSNFIGRGPGNSVQRDFLPHAESDFIFAIIIEELGILGAFFVAFLYLALLIRITKIAQRCTTFFPAFLILGFGMMITLQAFVNMSVAVGLIPITGQTLPLISKGGTSIIIISCYIAMILSVSRYAEKKSQNAQPVMAVANAETSEYYSDGPMA